MGTQFVSIDIGSYSTKIVNASESGAGIAVEAEYNFKTPPGAILSGELTDENLLVEELRALVKANKLEGKKAICTMQSMDVINREYSLPYVKEREIETMLRYEIAQYLPINMDKSVLQYKVVGSFMEEDRKMLLVVAVLMPKALTDRYYKLLTDVKLKPAALDIHFNSLSKIYTKTFAQKAKKSEPDDALIIESKLFVDLGHENVIINIMKNDVTKITRMLPFGGSDLITAIASEMDLPAEEAEVLLRKVRDINNEDIIGAEQKAASIIKQVFAGWAQQIGNTMEFYSTREKSGIKEIKLYGGLSNIPGVCKFFEEQLLIPVSDLSSLKVVTAKSQIDTASLINALGAVIRR